MNVIRLYTILRLDNQITWAILDCALFESIPTNGIEVVDWTYVSFPKPADLSQVLLLLMSQLAYLYRLTTKRNNSTGIDYVWAKEKIWLLNWVIVKIWIRVSSEDRLVLHHVLLFILFKLGLLLELKPSLYPFWLVSLKRIRMHLNLLLIIFIALNTLSGV